MELTSLPVRSKDALQVYVDATFQYRLKIVLGELVDVYYKWGTVSLTLIPRTTRLLTSRSQETQSEM